MSSGLVLWVAISGISVFAGDNLLRNGDLSKGGLSGPTAWRRQSLLVRETEAMAWIHQPGKPGELRITNRGIDLERWSQTLNLLPGWYLLNGEMRVHGRAAEAMLGVSVAGEYFGWSPVGETDKWVRGGIYFRVGDGLDDRDSDNFQVEVIFQVSSRTVASCRTIRLVKIEGEPPNENLPRVDFVKEFSERAAREKLVRPRAFDAPHGSLWTVVMAFLFFGGIALAGWSNLGRVDLRRSQKPGRCDWLRRHWR